MAYTIKDAETERIIRRLARAKGKPILHAIREACRNELEQEGAKVPLWERLQPLVQRVAAHPVREADARRTSKEFFDDMWDDR